MNKKFRNIAFTAICSSFMVNAAVSAVSIKSVNIAVTSVFGNTNYNSAFIAAVRNNLNNLASFNVEKKKVKEKQVEGGHVREVEVEEIRLKRESDRRTESIKADRECVICAENLKYDGTEDIVITNCNHCYHKHCIGEWLSRHNRDCPVCKKVLIGGACDLLISNATYNQAQNNNAHQHIHNNPMLNPNPNVIDAQNNLGNQRINGNPLFNVINNMFGNMQQVPMSPLIMPNAFSAPRYLRAPLFYQAIPNIFRYCTENVFGDDLSGVAMAIAQKNMFAPNLLNKDQIPDNYFKKLPLLNGTLSRHIHAQCAYCGRTCWNNDVNSTYIITSCHHAYHPQCLKQHMQNLGLHRNAIACPCRLCGGTILPQGYAVLKDGGQKLTQWVQSIASVM